MELGMKKERDPPSLKTLPIRVIIKSDGRFHWLKRQDPVVSWAVDDSW